MLDLSGEYRTMLKLSARIFALILIAAVVLPCVFLSACLEAGEKQPVTADVFMEAAVKWGFNAEDGTDTLIEDDLDGIYGMTRLIMSKTDSGGLYFAEFSSEDNALYFFNDGKKRTHLCIWSKPPLIPRSVKLLI